MDAVRDLSRLEAGVPAIDPEAKVETRWSTRRRRSDHPYYVGTAIFALLLTIVGFAPGIIDPSRRNGSTTPIVLLHGLSTAAWLGLYLTQTLLAASGRLRQHRRFGMAGGVLSALVVVSGVVATMEAARRGTDLSGDLERWTNGFDFVDAMILPFGDILVFGAFVAVALLFRRRPDAHKRLMLFAMLGGLIAAPAVHIVGHFAVSGVLAAVVVLGSLVSSAVHDLISRRSIHPVSWIAPVVIIGLSIARGALAGSTTVWRDFVSWWISM